MRFVRRLDLSPSRYRRLISSQSNEFSVRTCQPSTLLPRQGFRSIWRDWVEVEKDGRPKECAASITGMARLAHFAHRISEDRRSYGITRHTLAPHTPP